MNPPAIPRQADPSLLGFGLGYRRSHNRGEAALNANLHTSAYSVKHLSTSLGWYNYSRVRLKACTSFLL